MMRVVEHPFTGELLHAANDDELVEAIVAAMAESHPDSGWDDARARELVAESAYTASDS
jgi:hypothetical protein